MLSQKKIIISHLLASDEAMTSFLFEPPTSTSLRAHPNVLAYDSWELNDEQQLLVRAALDIWSGNGNVFLWELLSKLNRKSLSRLIEALEYWRDLKPPVEVSAPAPRSQKI